MVNVIFVTSYMRYKEVKSIINSFYIYQYKLFLHTQGLGIDVVDKIYLEFETPWWNLDCDGFSILRDEETQNTELNEKVIVFLL